MQSEDELLLTNKRSELQHTLKKEDFDLTAFSSEKEEAYVI